MPKRPGGDTQLPPDVISHWPEVFKDLDVKVVPLEYLHSVRIFFKDGKIWEIDIEKSKEKVPDENLEETLSEMFSQYAESIINVDFRLDTQRLKSDIQARTKLFMKKRK